MYDLGLSSEQFWEETTPPQFSALCRRLDVRLRQKELWAAITPHTLVQINSTSDSPSVPLSTFMPFYGEKEEEPAPKEITQDEIAAKLAFLFRYSEDRG